MPKALWFALGISLALMFLAVLLAGPLARTEADGARMIPIQTNTALPEPSPTPTATPPTVRLQWWREGGLAGHCEHLEIDSLGQVYYAPCGEGPRFAQLTEKELETYFLYLAQYGSFGYSIQEDDSQASIRMHFTGRGSQPPPREKQAEITRWAERVFDRLMTAERRADMVAAARLDLATRLEISTEEISILSVKATTWPDACLGIQQSGLFCAQVQTPGYRILLGYKGQAFEYRTDMHGMVRAFPTPQPASP